MKCKTITWCEAWRHLRPWLHCSYRGPYWYTIQPEHQGYSSGLNLMLLKPLANKVHIANNTNKLQTIRHHKHLCKLHLIMAMDSAFVPVTSHLTPSCYSWSQIHQSGFFLDIVTVDSDHVVPDRVQTNFFKCCRSTKMSYIWLLQNIQRRRPCWSHCQFGSRAAPKM